MPTDDLARRIKLERADAEQGALDRAIQRIESLDGNEIYQKAWKVAVRHLRDLQSKPTVNCQINNRAANS